MTEEAFVTEEDVVDLGKALPTLREADEARDDLGVNDEYNVNNSNDDISRTNPNSTSIPSKEQIETSVSSDTGQDVVKTLVRTNHLPALKPMRRYLWQAILDRRMTETRGFPDASLAGRDAYEETIVSCFGSTGLPSEEPGLPAFVDHSHTSCSHFLTSRGRLTVARILNALEYNSPQVQYCPQLYSMCSLARHFLSESDTYKLMNNLLTSKQTSYLIQSRLQAEVSWRVTMELSQKLCRKYVTYLQAESSKEELEGLFQQCIWWVVEWLPFPYLARIFDTFLVEGDKVIYRVNCALISLFTRKLQGKSAPNTFYNSSSGSDHGGSESGQKWSGAIKKRGLQGAFIHFCREIPVSPRTLLEKCFRYRNFSKATIAQLKMKAEIEVKSLNLPLSEQSTFNQRTQSADNVHDSTNGSDQVKAISNNLTYKQLSSIWRWIPQRLTMGTPQLAYASYNDGVSLNTFYTRSESYEPTVLVIKTTEAEVFGAFCSTSWSQRGLKDERGGRQIYFGGGETFLFSFSEACLSEGEEVAVYPWVLGPSAPNKIDQSQLSKAELHSHQLFMAGQHDMISIGGGGGNGIYIDATLSRGKTEACKTFGNPPLCKTPNFEISSIEVFGLGLAD